MQCVPINDETYRRAARIAHINDVDLAPVSDPDFADMRAKVDAVLQHALRAGLLQMELHPVTS